MCRTDDFMSASELRVGQALATASLDVSVTFCSSWYSKSVFTDQTSCEAPCMFAQRHHRGQHRMILVVVLVHPVATDGVQVRDRIDESPIAVEVVAIGRNRRSGRPSACERRCRLHVARRRQAEVLELLRGERRSARHRGSSHSPSPSKQKYSMPRQVLPGTGTMRPAPVVEVLDAPDLHARRVDVDPVVRKELVPAEDQRHRQEVAVAQAVGGRS